MAIRIKVNRTEFNQAVANGEIYGLYLERFPKVYVYAELGSELEYIPRDGDYQDTDYKMFIGCQIELYQTQKDLDSGKSSEVIRCTVIIYC